MVDTSVDETERSFWYDDPQGRAPMTEAIQESEKLQRRIAELETERDAARKERNEYFAERNKACERASALGAELSDCKADLAAYEAQRPDDDTFLFLAASYERKISQLEAERDALRKDNERLRDVLVKLSRYKIYDIDIIVEAALAAKEE